MTKLTTTGQIIASELERKAEEIETVVKAGNPHHDPKTGQFTSGGGEGANETEQAMKDRHAREYNALDKKAEGDFQRLKTLGATKQEFDAHSDKYRKQYDALQSKHEQELADRTSREPANLKTGNVSGNPNVDAKRSSGFDPNSKRFLTSKGDLEAADR